MFRGMHSPCFTPTPPWLPVAARGAGVGFLAFAAAARHHSARQTLYTIFVERLEFAGKNVVVFSEAASCFAECSRASPQARQVLLPMITLTHAGTFGHIYQMGVELSPTTAPYHMSDSTIS